MQPMTRRDFLFRHGLRYGERNWFGEDCMPYTRCLQAGARWWVTPELLYHYSIRPGSLTSVQTANDLKWIAQLEAELLADPAITAQPRLTKALRRHKAKIDWLQSYRAVTDAVKQRRFGSAMQGCYNPGAARSIAAKRVGAELPSQLATVDGVIAPKCRADSKREP